ncbi:MAG: hypothetical protein GX900_08200 [Clostridiaceae bacterium]|nr:hypothetical protein [Clostridiaceae bacterium]
MDGIYIFGYDFRFNGIFYWATRTLDMKPKFIFYRFGVLSNPEVFASANTDGNFVRWYKDGLVVAELGFAEIMKMVLGEAY